MNLAELRASAKPTRPTFVKRLTLDIELIADIERLQTEKQDLLHEAEAHKGDDAKPRKGGAGVGPRLAEVDQELVALFAKMRESEGELLIRGMTGGEWQRWKDEHPPREDNVTDETVAGGICNASALLADLGKYAAEWNGEALAEGDWSGWMADMIAPGDLRDLVAAFVWNHEKSGVRIPKSLTELSPTEPSETD